jgi:hypothetical protein
MHPEDVLVPLHTGERMPAREVLATLAYLRTVLKRADGEALITDLYRLCQDPAHRLDPKFIPELLSSRDILPQPFGELKPAAATRAVLCAAYRLTPEGVVLANPVVPSEQNRDILARAEAAFVTRFDQMMRDPWPEDDTPAPGPRR